MVTFGHDLHCVKSVGIRIYSGPYFPAFGLNTDQNNSEYGRFLRSVGDHSRNLQIVCYYVSRSLSKTDSLLTNYNKT